MHAETPAWALRIVFGVVTVSVPVLAGMTAPVLLSLIAVPLVVLYPVLITWLGVETASKIVFGVISSVFPIALNALVGVREFNRGYGIMAAAMGASRSCMYQNFKPGRSLQILLYQRDPYIRPMATLPTLRPAATAAAICEGVSTTTTPAASSARRLDA